MGVGFWSLRKHCNGCGVYIDGKDKACVDADETYVDYCIKCAKKVRKAFNGPPKGEP